MNSLLSYVQLLLFSAESSGRSSVGSYRSVYVKCDRLREANMNRHKHRHKHRLLVKY